MKKVLTFLFAFALIGGVAFSQNTDDLSEKAKSMVKELDQAANLTEAQEKVAINVFTEALNEIATKRSDVNSKESSDAYMEFSKDRIATAFSELKSHISSEQYQQVEAFAIQKGLVKDPQKSSK